LREAGVESGDDPIWALIPTLSMLMPVYQYIRNPSLTSINFSILSFILKLGFGSKITSKSRVISCSATISKKYALRLILVNGIIIAKIAIRKVVNKLWQNM